MTRHIEALRDKRAALIQQAKALIPKDRNTPVSNEQMVAFDLLMTQIDDLQTEITLSMPGDQHAKAMRAFAMTSPDAYRQEEHKPTMRAFTNFLKYGINGLDADERALMVRQQQGDPLMIRAAQSVGVGSGGGYAVPDEAMRPLVGAMKASGGLLEQATIVPSETGADLPIPTDDETAVSGEIITENSVHNEEDIAFSQVVLQSFLYSSKIVRVSIQLMDDAGFDFGGHVMKRLGERLGRITSTHWVTGDGSSKPRGIVTAASTGKTAASATAVTYDEIVDLMHSVNQVYRQNGSWLMNDTTFSALRKLKDSQNRPLYGDLSNQAPTTLLGKPVVIDPNMPAMTSGLKPILFGDLKSYHIRLVKQPRVLRLEERYADYAQIGFLAFLRADGDLIDGGGGAVKVMQMA